MNVTDGDRERAAEVDERAAYRGREVLKKCIAQALADERGRALRDCAAWMETLSSPTLHGDPFIRAVDWAAGLVRDCAQDRHQSPQERRAASPGLNDTDVSNSERPAGAEGETGLG